MLSWQGDSSLTLCCLKSDAAGKAEAPNDHPKKSRMLQIAADRSPIATDHTGQPWLPEDKGRQDSDFFLNPVFEVWRSLKSAIADRKSQPIARSRETKSIPKRPTS